MRSLGHGQRTELDAAAAHARARESKPDAPRGVDEADPAGLRDGQQVTVTPDDYGKVPVQGELVTLRYDEVAVRREDPRVGTVVVHFPRVGYRVECVA